jgi:small subunit ribosomal protein S21|tara:strand:+ start:52 stop:240 length:189 start_codon:yes stop_codon:yes gene_type:complete
LIEVKVRKNNIEKAISQFKRKVKDSKILLELQDRRFYEKPSITKRKKRLKAKLRMKKNSQNN